MSQAGYTASNPIELLTKADVSRIHTGALDVLENTGVVFQHDRALNILRDVGCTVDKNKMRVTFPCHLVEASLKKCPSNVVIKGRNPKYDLRLGAPCVYFSVHPAQDRFDHERLEKRPPSYEELAADFKVQNYLDQVHWAGYASGIPNPLASAVLKAPIVHARNNEKPGWLGFSPQALKWGMEVCQVIGARWLVSIGAAPPLTRDKGQLEVMMMAAEAGYPLKPAVGCSMGANSPATLAGSLVQSVAEIMAVIVLAQAVRPGVGVVPRDYTQPLDMRTGSVIQGAIERSLIGAAWAQIWRSYGIPSTTMVSSDAKVPDYQCAMEKVIGVTLQALAGSSLITFMGAVHDELCGSPVVTIIDNELAHMIGRMLRGIDVTDRTLAVEVIKEVGPAPGHFLGNKHTREMWRGEQMIPDLTNRLPYSEWLKQGGGDLTSKAKEKYEEIVNNYEPTPLSKEQESELDRIQAGIERALEKKPA